MKQRFTIICPFAALFGLMACGPNTEWREAFDATESGWLMNTWAVRQDLMFAVGGEPERSTILRYDGSEWIPETIPQVPLINWVFGFGEESIYAVGNDGTILRRAGEQWESMESPTDEDLWGVWGMSADDLWAVGGSGFPDATATIVHFDGTTWELVEIPELERDAHGIFKVWGSGPSDVYAVGHRGLVLHYDGDGWTELFVGASDDLIAVWGTGPDNVLAVGGRSNGIVSHFDGTEWHSERLSPLPGFNGVWTRHAARAHVVGVRGTLLTIELPSLEVEESSIVTTSDFHAVFGIDGRLTAVGGNLASGFSGDQTGLAYWRDLEDSE